MNLREITISDRDRTVRCIPHTLDVDLRRLCLDLLDEIEAELAADAVRESPRALLRNLVRLRLLVLADEHLGPLCTRPCRKFMVRPLIHEAFQRRLVPRTFLLACRVIFPEPNPLKVAVEQRRLVRILRMEAQQRLVKLHRLHLVRVALRFPFQKFLGRSKNRSVRLQLKLILRLRRRLLARCVKSQRLVREEIIECGPIRIRHRALV